MTLRQLNWTLGVAAAVFLIPWQGKQLYPEIFGTPLIQWGSAAITAVLLSGGAFLSLRLLLSNPPDRRKVGWNCASFFLIFLLIIGMYAVMIPMSSRLVTALEGMHGKSPLPGLLRQLNTQITPERRQEIASAIYRAAGQTVLYESTDGRSVLYTPSAKDKAMLEKNGRANAEQDRMISTIRESISQWHYLLTGYIATFLLVFLIGTLVLTYRRSSAP